MPETIELREYSSHTSPEKEQQAEIPKKLRATVKRFDAALEAYMLIYAKFESPEEVQEEREYYNKGRVEFLSLVDEEGVMCAKQKFDEEIDDLNERRRDLEEELEEKEKT